MITETVSSRVFGQKLVEEDLIVMPANVSAPANYTCSENISFSKGFFGLSCMWGTLPWSGEFTRAAGCRYDR